METNNVSQNLAIGNNDSVTPDSTLNCHPKATHALEWSDVVITQEMIAAEADIDIDDAIQDCGKPQRRSTDSLVVRVGRLIVFQPYRADSPWFTLTGQEYIDAVMGGSARNRIAKLAGAMKDEPDTLLTMRFAEEDWAGSYPVLYKQFGKLIRFVEKWLPATTFFWKVDLAEQGCIALQLVGRFNVIPFSWRDLQADLKMGVGTDMKLSWQPADYSTLDAFVAPCAPSLQLELAQRFPKRKLLGIAGKENFPVAKPGVPVQISKKQKHVIETYIHLTGIAQGYLGATDGQAKASRASFLLCMPDVITGLRRVIQHFHG